MPVIYPHGGGAGAIMPAVSPYILAISEVANLQTIKVSAKSFQSVKPHSRTA